MNHQHHDSKMMWLMMLGCALPLLLATFFGSGGSSAGIWIVIGIGGMVLLHWIAMRKSGDRHSDHEQSSNLNSENKSDKLHHHCH